MKITTVLFDLDGTLIGMDQDRFIEEYFKSIITKLSSLGYNGDLMKNALYRAVGAALRNDGAVTNEARFWQVYEDISGVSGSELAPVLEDYYKNDFPSVIDSTCYGQERAREVLDRAKKTGRKAILATNPLFPIEATVCRMKKSSLSPDDFEYVTAYENSSFCKPNSAYFTELLEKCGVLPEECVMIGNDTRDDFCAHEVGIPVFVLTDCLINTSGAELADYPHGSFDELLEYIDSLD